MVAPTLKTCVITGYILSPSNVPQVAVKLEITSPAAQPDNTQSDVNAFLVEEQIEVYTDATGMFTFTLPQGIDFLVVCEVLGLNHIFQVPYCDTEQFDHITGYWRREKSRPDKLEIPSGDWFSTT